MAVMASHRGLHYAAGQALEKLGDVRRPYLNMHKLKLIADGTRVGMEARFKPTLPPLGHPMHGSSLSASEATRNMAIAGSLAVRAGLVAAQAGVKLDNADQVLAAVMAHPCPKENDKIPFMPEFYLPVKRASYQVTNAAGMDERARTGSDFRVAAYLERIGTRSAKAISEISCDDSGLLMRLDVDYHLLPSKDFIEMVVGGADKCVPAEPSESDIASGANPYVAWPSMSSTAIDVLPAYVDATCNGKVPACHKLDRNVTFGDLGIVKPDQCVGHFGAAAAYPVSILLRNVENVVQRHLGKEPSSSQYLSYGRLEAKRFAWPGDHIFVIAKHDFERDSWRIDVVAYTGSSTELVATFFDFVFTTPARQMLLADQGRALEPSWPVDHLGTCPVTHHTDSGNTLLNKLGALSFLSAVWAEVLGSEQTRADDS